MSARSVVVRFLRPVQLHGRTYQPREMARLSPRDAEELVLWGSVELIDDLLDPPAERLTHR